MKKWYKGQYRRNLVDMHVEDRREEFLSKFNAETYYNNLKKAHVTAPMIYLQSHTGLCNFKTRLAKEHNAFAKTNEIKKLVSLCKEGGMKVVGYYSLIFNTWAEVHHPDWTIRYADGETWREKGQRYGLCCPNNEEYRSFVVGQIKEMAEEFPELDGIFYDMPYWEVVCHCPSCKAKFKKEYGKQMPLDIDWKNEDWNDLVRARQKWMGEFVKFVKEQTNAIMPNVTVEFNFAAVVGCDWLAGSTELINDSCEFTGGDLYGDLYNHSFTAKYYYSITKNQPFEYMTCRCNRTLREHTITKPEIMEEAEVMLSAMHHGATLLIDAINPDGTMDERVYEQMGRVFEKQIPLEKYMDKGELYSAVAVYFDSTTQFKGDNKFCNKDGAINSVRTLIENHIPVSVIANGSLNELTKYQVIIASELANFKNDEILKFIPYVENGGTLYLSGESDRRLLKEFFGGEITGKTFGESPFKHVNKGYEEVQCYVAPTTQWMAHIMGSFNEKYPLPITYKAPIMEGAKGEVLAKFVYPYTDPDDNISYASIHSNPPAHLVDIPAIMQVNYGKGKVIWSSCSIENDQRINFKDIFANIVKENIALKYKIEASKYVELVIFEDGDETYISLFDLNFYNDVVERKFAITLDGKHEIENLQTGEKTSFVGTYMGSFEKYVWFKVNKIS